MSISLNNKQTTNLGKSYRLTWLVVWIPLKHISQLGLLFPIYGQIKYVPNHESVPITKSLELSILKTSG